MTVWGRFCSCRREINSNHTLLVFHSRVAEQEQYDFQNEWERRMNKLRLLAATAAITTILTACSGGGSESNDVAETGDAEVQSSGEAGPEETASDDLSKTKDGIDYAGLTGDAASGKAVFAQCRTCHVTDLGVNRTGPTLAGIVGAEAGAVDGYKYSPANENSGLTWSEEQLYVYLEDPQRIMPKTKMIFAGIPDAQKRADVIAYLKDPS